MSTPFSSSSPLMNYRVAAIQYEPALGEKARNVDALVRLTEEAMLQGARLVVLPEMATTGYCWQSRAEIAPFVESIPGPTTERFQQLAARYQSFVAVALPEIDPLTQVYYNTMALVGPEGLVGVYRKIHSYISEPRWARDGDMGMPVWETPLGRLSGLICMDAMYFEAARIPALHGADVLLFPTNWVGNEHYPSSWWMARAFENGVYLIAANRYGDERGVQFSGGSCILNPDGSIQASRTLGDGIIYGEIDLTRCRDKQWGDSSLGNLLSDRRPREYISLTHNSYLWEPLRYHSLYDLGELPPGQLSCTGIVQTRLQDFVSDTSQVRPPAEMLSFVRQMVHTLIKDAGPAQPDVLVLPELLLPGPSHTTSHDEFVSHMRKGAISIPGPETDALTALTDELQVSLVLGVAERADNAFYNTVLLIDPGGVYGKYRKLHLTRQDRLWATAGDTGLLTFDTPVGRIGLATGYDVLFPETLRVLAGQGVDLVCAPALLDFPGPLNLVSESGSMSGMQARPFRSVVDSLSESEEEETPHYLLWRVRAAENNIYLALANWTGDLGMTHANGNSGIFPPATSMHPWSEVVVEEDEMSETLLTMMTIDTREQRTGRRTTQALGYAPGDVAGSLTGELDYDVRDSIPGNSVRGKPFLRKRQPYWYLDLVQPNDKS